jgi:hypothetical protein
MRLFLQSIKKGDFMSSYVVTLTHTNNQTTTINLGQLSNYQEVFNAIGNSILARPGAFSTRPGFLTVRDKDGVLHSWPVSQLKEVTAAHQRNRPIARDLQAMPVIPINHIVSYTPNSGSGIDPRIVLAAGAALGVLAAVIVGRRYS